MLTTESIKTILSKSLDLEIDSLLETYEIKNNVGREVIDCKYSVAGRIEQCVLKAYHKGCDDDSELGVVRVASKNFLASRDLNVRSIKIPKVFGIQLSDEISCILMEKLDQTQWVPENRIEAAEILARLHNVSLDSLSDNLQQLIQDSKPNRDRGRLGVTGRGKYLDAKFPGWRKRYPELSRNTDKIAGSVEPFSSMKTLVHGDYFSVNLIPTADGLYVIDWDLLALGDPMWDLGFLVGADNGVDREEFEEVVQIYKRTRSVVEQVLRWQVECWNTLRELIKLMKKYGNQKER